MATLLLYPSKCEKKRIDHTAYMMKYRKDHPGIDKAINAAYYIDHADAIKSNVSKWRKIHPSEVKTYQRRWRQSDDGKVFGRKVQSIRRRDMGYELLNEYSEGFEGHHINDKQVVFIPAEMHKKHKHNHKKPETMHVINRISMQYLFNCKS